MIDCELLRGVNTGYRRGQRFYLQSGRIWQQTDFVFDYEMAYRPTVLVECRGRTGRLRLASRKDWVAVQRLK
jgi:hypothetical protein